MIEFMGVRTTAREGDLADTLGNETRAHRANIPHGIY